MKTILALCLVWLSTTAFTAMTCTDYTVANSSSRALGTVMISGSASSTSVDVPGTGVYTTPVCFTVSSITINNQTVVYPNSAVVTTPSGAGVRVNYSGTHGVEVLDLMQQNSPGQGGGDQ